MLGEPYSTVASALRRAALDPESEIRLAERGVYTRTATPGAGWGRTPGGSDTGGPLAWEDVCAMPGLRDLQFKVELDGFGRLLMSPTASRHVFLQRRFQRILEDALGGVAVTECPVHVGDGVRVADVGWMEEGFARARQDEAAFSVAPPICVEVMSPSNVWAEMEEKVTLYLAKGAQEVWICEASGRLRWFGHEGERASSALVPDAPATVTL